jgi:hypothetical protein
MKTNRFSSFTLLPLFIFCLYFLALSLMIMRLERDVKNLNTEVKELRILFNQKFLQEMVVNKPLIKFEL